MDLVNLAAQSPSASNSQPWRFLIVVNREVIEAMHRAVAQEQQKILAALSGVERENFAEYSCYFLHFIGAPTVIVPIYKPIEILSHYLSGTALQDAHGIQYMEHLSGVVSISLAIENLLLSAHEKGLGASCMSGPLIANTALREILSVPARWQIALLIPLGYPDESPEPKPRKGAEQIVKWI